MKAYIISLSKIPSSAESSKKVLDQLLKYGLKAELFEGTYGFDAQSLFEKHNRKIARYGIKTETLSRTDYSRQYPNSSLPENILNITVRTEIDPTGRMAKVMRPGVIGCFYSHYRLWEKCIALNEPILIFEDDVMFEREYIPVEWQEALLLCTGKDAHMHDFFSSKLYNPSGTPQAVTLPNTSMPGAVGYAIKPEAARKLVDYYREEYLPADNAMNAFVIKLECHTYLMGRAARAEEGKQSLTATKLWNKKL